MNWWLASSLTRAGNAADSFICISFGLCRRWMFTNAPNEVTDLLRWWLVGELAVGV